VSDRRGAVYKSLLNHKTRSTNISAIEIAGPGYHWPLKTFINNVNFANAEVPTMRVTVDGNIDSNVALNEALSISGR
jgi:hypothetical protein